MSQANYEELQQQLDALRRQTADLSAELRRRDQRPWRWLRRGLMLTCIAVPATAIAFDPFADFGQGDTIFAADMNARFSAIANALDSLEGITGSLNCPEGSSIRAVAPDGTVTCEEDNASGTEFPRTDEDIVTAVSSAGYVTGAHTTDTTLTESEVDAFVGNNGYLTGPLTCSAGNAIRSVDAAGAVTCATIPADPDSRLDALEASMATVEAALDGKQDVLPTALGTTVVYASVTATDPEDVGLSVEITSQGGPVRIELMPSGVGSSQVEILRETFATGASFTLLRDGVAIDEVPQVAFFMQAGTGVSGDPGRIYMSVPVSAVSFTDVTASPGTHVYSLSAQVGYGGAELRIFRARIVARELPTPAM